MTEKRWKNYPIPIAIPKFWEIFVQRKFTLFSKTCTQKNILRYLTTMRASHNAKQVTTVGNSTTKYHNARYRLTKFLFTWGKDKILLKIDKIIPRIVYIYFILCKCLAARHHFENILCPEVKKFSFYIVIQTQLLRSNHEQSKHVPLMLTFVLHNIPGVLFAVK